MAHKIVDGEFQGWSFVEEPPNEQFKTYSIEEANSKMQVYQAVAIKTNDGGERTDILEDELLLAESEQKARDKFVRGLSDEYDAGSDDVELTTFL